MRAAGQRHRLPPPPAPPRAARPGQRCALAGRAGRADARAPAAATDRPDPAMARGLRTHPPPRLAVRARALRGRPSRSDPTGGSAPCSRSSVRASRVDSHSIVCAVGSQPAIVTANLGSTSDRSTINSTRHFTPPASAREFATAGVGKLIQSTENRCTGASHGPPPLPARPG